MSVLSKRKVQVRLEGQIVKLIVGDPSGDIEIGFEYETALQVSQWLRVNAKMAKNLAGDKSRHWSTVGVLGDLNGDPKGLVKVAAFGHTFDVGVK